MKDGSCRFFSRDSSSRPDADDDVAATDDARF